MLTKLYRCEFIFLSQGERLGIDSDDDRDYYFNNGKLELRDGQFELYYDSGNILGKGFYENGYKVGAWQSFYESGQIMQRGFYINEGNRFGIEDWGDTWEHYDEDGRLESFCEKWKTIQKRFNKVK